MVGVGAALGAAVMAATAFVAPTAQAAPAGRELRHVVAAEQDAARSRLLEPGQHAQQGHLEAAARIGGPGQVASAADGNLVAQLHVLGGKARHQCHQVGVVTSANVSCGFHAGSPEGIRATLAEATDRGVVIGDGSDVGGGASIMGTLSGGGTQRVSLGERCLLGAESGLGIALGDDCVVEAGLYLTAGTKVTMPDGTVTKAVELSGGANMLFLRNSETGAVECRARAGRGIELNADLHKN
mgnify:CR=1 FL=1